MLEVVSCAAAMRLFLIPVRSKIQLSEVSTILDISSLDFISAGK